ncbi:MAG: hypothetical protein WEB88_09120 [Gemmatimonadota bacterium]
MTLTYRTMILGAALALMPAALAAQQGNAAARIEASVRAAAQAQIPTALLESKINEGRAKGVAEERIAAAVEARLEALLNARSVMARSSDAALVTAGELAVAADALQAGVSQEVLLRIHSDTPREGRVVATAVLASLVQLGAGSEQALAQVRAAARRGPEGLAELRANTNARLRARGRIPPIDVGAAARNQTRVRINH